MSNDQPNMIIYRTADGKSSVALFAKDGKVWLSQQQMAELFATSKPNISMHIANILKEKELNEISVVKKFLTTAADGKNYNVVFTQQRLCERRQSHADVLCRDSKQTSLCHHSSDSSRVNCYKSRLQ